MNKYLEKIAASRKKNQLKVKAGQKPLVQSKGKPFISLGAKIKSLPKQGHKRGK